MNDNDNVRIQQTTYVRNRTLLPVNFHYFCRMISSYNIHTVASIACSKKGLLAVPAAGGDHQLNQPPNILPR